MSNNKIIQSTNKNKKLKSHNGKTKKQDQRYHGKQFQKPMKPKDKSSVDDHMFKDFLNLRGGGCACARPSSVIGFIENDEEFQYFPLNPGKLSPRYIRNTNVAKVYEQRGGNCYAFAACSAYVNTNARIYGSIKQPSFAECYQYANYNGNLGGDPVESIRKIENHFHCGICCEKTNYITIRDIITISVIVVFSTSKSGWESVAQGELMHKMNGLTDDSHAALVEGYDFEKDCLICKNSWGENSAEPRFNFVPEAAHGCYFIRVYFTMDSIEGKTNRIFIPNISRFTGNLKGKEISCAWMDEKTAFYSSEFVSEYHPEHKGHLKYLRYDTNEWITNNLNRKKTHQNQPFFFKLGIFIEERIRDFIAIF